MNKKFLSAILFGALMVTSTGTFVSCKDYDDDIDSLQGQVDTNVSAIDALKSQLSSLQTAGDAAKAEAAAAKAAADAAKAAGDTAKATAEEAKAAAAQAKADAIAEAKQLVEKLAADVAANKLDADQTKAELSVLSGKIEAIETGLSTLTPLVNKALADIAAVKADLEIQKAALENLKAATGSSEDIEILLGYIQEVEANLGLVTGNLSNRLEDLETLLNDEINAIRAEIYGEGSSVMTMMGQLYNSLMAEINTLNVMIAPHLSSLVFQPDFYYQGIEAMRAYGFTYTAQKVKTVNADGDFGTDAPEADAETTMIPDLVADYHINPTSASVPSEISAYSFLAFDKEYARAASTTINPNVTKVSVKDGILTVNAHITDGIIKDIATQDSVTVMALQVETGDTVVTSDYAAVKAENFKDLVIAAADDIHPIATDDRHLFTKAEDAIKDTKHVVELLWNSEGVAIDSLINTHYTKANGTHAAWDEYAADAEVEKYGFKYSYELVGYHKGNNKTSESAHAALKGAVIRPQITSNGKQQAWGAEQNKATKDREPLVRILLTDTVSNKIAAVGYLKFKIVDKETPTKSQVVLKPSFPFANGYTVNCSEDEIKLALSWHQVEEQILAQLENLGISKADFHNDFKLDGGEANATQYDGVAVDSKAVTTPVGVVAQTTWDPSDEMTEVLTWTVTNNEAYQIFKAGKTSITVNVRYSYEVSTGVYQYVYVTFVWAPQPLNYKPNGEIANAAKINMYWYAKNGSVAGAGYSDIHANVKQVISSDAADCTFESEILNTMTGNKITVTNDATYPAFADDKLDKKVVFADPQDHLAKENDKYIVKGASGKKYAISVSGDKKTLYAAEGTNTPQPVVVLSGDQNTLMTYQENEVAKDILNYADHNFLNDGETFTAKLMFDAGLCEEVAYDLKNKVFYAKYLRPVSAEPSDVDELVDATNGASIATLTLNLIDWRDKKFDVEADTKGDDGTVYDFYKFYGVDKVTADIENATTDLNNGKLGTTKLQDVTKLVDLRFGQDVKGANEATTVTKGNNGKFYYYNNGTTLGKFTIRVPLKLTYKWGEIYTSVDLNINKTIQN